MWVNIGWVGLGGALGSILRYGVGVFMAGTALGTAGRFPLATLLVNVAGSLLIGILFRYAEHGSSAHLLGVVGFCGGFTTFSAFSIESLRMLKNGQTGLALLYVAVSVLLCLGATMLGTMIKTR